MTDGLIIAGRRVPVPGVRVVTWEDDPRVPRVTKGSHRDASAVTAVVLHTSRGRTGKVVPGSRESDKAMRLARYQARTSHQASWHLTVGADGTVIQQADLATFATWHASQANGWSVGIELAQDSDTPDLTRAQVDACVAVVRAICEALKVPLWVPARHHGRSWSVESRPVRAWQSRKQGGESRQARGVIGHRNLTTNRGPGDPGDGAFLALLAMGFAGVEPEAMTVGAATAAPLATPALAEEPDDTHDEDDDAPAWPPLPAWVDASLEVPDAGRITITPKAWVEESWEHLAALGVFGDARLEVIAHCAAECSWGTRALGFNAGGVKLKERDDAEHRAKHGRGLAWWRDFGHVESGDDEVELYRAWDSAADFWAFFVKRYAPRSVNVDTPVRYVAAGRAFWGPTPAEWFVELLRAGYRGKARALELAALADPETHPSVVAHRKLVARVRELLT